MKTSICHQFTELKARSRYFIWDRVYYGRLFIGSKFILVQRALSAFVTNFNTEDLDLSYKWC